MGLTAHKGCSRAGGSELGWRVPKTVRGRHAIDWYSRFRAKTSGGVCAEASVVPRRPEPVIFLNPEA